MYQVKILQANQLDILEDIINMWLSENTSYNVVDIKFQNSVRGNETEYIAIMVYQQQ